MDLAGRTAVVTGASSGIGAATAYRLAREGATVVAVARREERLAQVVERCRRHAPDSVATPTDVADGQARDQLVASTLERFGRIDVLVNNAGIPMRRDVRELTLEDVRRVTEVNFVGAVALTLAVLPGMLERDLGAIVNVTSVSAGIPVPHAAAYGASKAALSRFTHGVQVDLHDTGVHAAVVSPGPIATEIWDRGAERNPYEEQGGRLHPPDVVADAIVRAIREGHAHRTAPRRYGVFGALYPLLQRPLRWGLARFGGSTG